MPAADRLPDYAPLLTDYHRAYVRELHAMLDSLPIGEGDHVLEVACGDGFYSRRLAERVGPTGVVVAADVLSAYLDEASEQDERSSVAFVAAAVQGLPFADGAFDLVFCAQSLYSLPEPVDAVTRMARVVRPGGVVAVLENDTMHHILLPWPVEVELAVRQAELLGFIDESDRPRKFYVGRQLGPVFRQAGLENACKRTWATNRHAPLEPEERGFLGKYVADLRDRALPRLEPAMRDCFDRLSDPASDAYILDTPDLAVTCLDHLICGTRPV